jgi:hypothetical protein
MISLSQEAKHLLFLARQSEEIYLLSNGRGKYVLVGKSRFPNRVQAYVRAFYALLENHLIRHSGGVRYFLTDQGVSIAQQLRDEDCT